MLQVVEEESSESEPESPGIDPLVFSRDDFDTGTPTEGGREGGREKVERAEVRGGAGMHVYMSTV